MSTHDTGTPQPQPPVDDVDEFERLPLDERSRIAAAVDGVHIVHRRDRFPIPGTRAERRAERAVAACFLLTFLGAVAFTVAYVVLPWRYDSANQSYTWFTPVLGLTMAVALVGIGIGVVLWAKWLMPEEEVVQERHEGRSPELDRRTAAASMVDGLAITGIARRSLLQKTLGLSALALGALAVVPLGGLIKKPRGLFETGWAEGVRLMTSDRRLVRPGDLLAGGIATVFPATPEGLSTQVVADSVVLLIRLRPGQTVRPLAGQEDFGWQDYIAYSKICTHAGCPASLYEQQTNRLLCPCHQSQFLITDQAKPIFGPATRRLPMLPLELEDEVLVAKSDFLEAVGPAFWERP